MQSDELKQFVGEMEAYKLGIFTGFCLGVLATLLVGGVFWVAVTYF